MSALVFSIFAASAPFAADILFALISPAYMSMISRTSAAERGFMFPNFSNSSLLPKMPRLRLT